MKKWTIILQINAENNLYFDSIKAFNELGVEGSTKDVNYVILFDGMKHAKTKRNSEFPGIYLMKKGMKFETARPKIRLTEKDDQLADPKVLTRILKLIKQTFPAENYGFIYKGHGGAGGTDVATGTFFTKRLIEKPAGTEKQVEKALVKLGGPEVQYEGYCISPDNKNFILAIYTNIDESLYLSYNELARILKKVFTINQLGFVCLDCCWGQQLEHGYSFRNTTRHFVASVDEMPSLGLGYADFSRYLNERPKILSKELANMLVAVYFIRNYDDYDSPIEEFRQMGVSLTCVNTFQLKKSIQLFNRLCDSLVKGMKKYHVVISNALTNCKDYTYNLPRDEYAVYNIDLVWFLENLIHYNKDDQELNHQVLEFIRHHTLYYIRAYLGNNYKTAVTGKKMLGGRGVAIAFPRTLDELETSIYFEKNKPDFVKYSNWKKMLLAFFKEKAAAAPVRAVALRTRSGIAPKLKPEITAVKAIEAKWGSFHPARYV